MKIGIIITGIAVATLIVLGLNYFFGRSEEVPASPPTTLETPVAVPGVVDVPVPSSPAVMEPTPPSPGLEEPVLVLPPLDESDVFVRERLVEAPLLEPWLSNDDLLRRLAVVIENGNRGELPRRQLSFMAPQGKFQVEKRGESVFMDPAGYARYDRYLDVLETLSPELAVTLISDAEPLLDQALSELGTGESPVPQIIAAIDQVLAVPVIRDDIELLQPNVLYEYADPRLEGLSSLQKQALRMGPDNLSRLQAYLALVREDLLRQ